MGFSASRHALVFHVGAHHFSVPTHRVSEIVHMASLVTSPVQPSVLAGFLNVRGAAIPVVRISQLFGLDKSVPRLYTPLIILNYSALECAGLDCAGMLTAIEAEGVEEVTEIDETGMRELGEGHSLNNCAQAAFTWNGHEVLMLSCDQLLLAKERECLREFQAATQQRMDALGPVAR
jgi:chemotaxis signal transduction protein